MSYQFPPDIEKIVQEYVVAGRYVSADDVLRDALNALRQFVHTAEEHDLEYRETVAAVREGIADYDAGRTRTLRSLIDELGSQDQGENAP